MSFTACRAALTGASLLALAGVSALALAGAAAAQDAPAPAGPQSTPFTLGTDQPRAPEQLAVRFDKADLALKVIPDQQAIEGVATLDFTATAPVDRLSVELDTLLAISEIRIDDAVVPAANWSNPEGRLTVELPRALAAGDKVVLTVAYAGKPRIAPHAPWDGGFMWTTAPDGSPWIATAVQPEGCDLFWPCIDHPLAEPGRVDLHITVPSNLSAPSNGRFLGKTDNGDGWTTWNWSAANPNTYAIALNIGPYEERAMQYESRYGNVIPVSYWHLRTDDPARVDALFAEFPMQLEFYERVIGPFPFGDEKMGVAETPHLGMEHQTINAYGNEYKLDGKGYDWLLQHELAHEWFGNQMTNVNADDMWLHEGLGSYMQPLYLRYLYGDRAMHAELAKQRLTIANKFPLVSGQLRTEDEVYQGEVGPGLDIYVKGSHIAHTLRMLIGDEAFFTSIRRLVYGRPDPRPGNFSPRYASTPEFLSILNEETGADLGWFFRAYLYQAALPDLRSEVRDGRLMLNWVTPDGGDFPMPVEVEVDGRLQTLGMTGGRGSLAVPNDSHIVIDPQGKVLRRVEYIEAFQARQKEDADKAAAEAAGEADE